MVVLIESNHCLTLLTTRYQTQTYHSFQIVPLFSIIDDEEILESPEIFV